MPASRLLSIGVFLPSLLLAGCGGSDYAVSISFSSLTPVLWSPIPDNRFIVARSAFAWEIVWREHGGGRAPPPVDFRDSMVIGIFLGSHAGSCRQPVVASITERAAPARIEVAYRETFITPGVACMPTAGYPSTLAVAPLSPLPVEFVPIR